MARVKNSDILKGYRGRLQASKKWREQEKLDKLWCLLVDLYRGKHYDDMGQSDQMVVNVSFATINVIGPSVSVNHPKITVAARKPEDQDRAIITEAVINYWWRHYGVQTEFKRAVKDFLIIGHGWIKTGYKYKKDQVDAAEGYDEEQASGQYDGTPVDDFADPKPDATVEANTVITEDRPFGERVSPHDLYVDPMGTCMNDIGWIAQRIRRSVAAVKADKRYLKAGRDKVVSGSYAKYDGENSYQKEDYRTDKAQSQGYVDVWEFYDLRRKTVCTFCDTTDENDGTFLIKPSPSPFAFGHPFVMIRNYEVPEHFYPMGDLEALEPLQRELNETRTQMLNHRKRYQRKWLFREASFDPKGRSALESDEDNTMVPVIGNEPLTDVMMPIPAIPIPPDFYQQSELIEQDIDRITGVSEYQRGGMPEVRRTATEAAMMQDAANARSADKLAIVEGFIAVIASRLIALAQEMLTGDQVVRVVGVNGGPNWLQFDREWIKGEFDFEVEAGSTQPNNESFRRQSALQMMDAMAPLIGAGVINLPKLAAHVLRDGFGISNPEMYVDPMGMAGMTPMMPPMGPEGSGGAPPGPPDGSGGPPPPTDGGGYSPQPMPPAPGMGGNIDPKTLAMLSTKVGLDTPNLG